jgi:hypothetical protein
VGAPTPVPWATAPGNFIVARWQGRDTASGRIVAEVPCTGGNPADLRFIVTACNSHADLMTACGALMLAVDELLTEFVSKRRSARWGVINEALLSASAALTKARQ